MTWVTAEREARWAIADAIEAGDLTVEQRRALAQLVLDVSRMAGEQEPVDHGERALRREVCWLFTAERCAELVAAFDR